MLFCPEKGLARHLFLDRVLIFAAAVLLVIRNGFIVVSLNAFDSMLDQEINDLIHKRRVTAQIAEMVNLLGSGLLCRDIGRAQSLYVAVDVAEYREFHLDVLISTRSHY